MRSVHGENAFTDTLEATLQLFDDHGEFVEVWQGEEWEGGVISTKKWMNTVCVDFGGGWGHPI
ncbi:MAG: hypothetical protein J6386_24685 [Candidatus Synoicihabitans palmerolidicus]|nr:hypothetical protein [Candidatus Synoicihabitans palmerolidicus]